MSPFKLTSEGLRRLFATPRTEKPAAYEFEKQDALEFIRVFRQAIVLLSKDLDQYATNASASHPVGTDMAFINQAFLSYSGEVHRADELHTFTCERIRAFGEKDDACDQLLDNLIGDILDLRKSLHECEGINAFVQGNSKRFRESKLEKANGGLSNQLNQLGNGESVGLDVVPTESSQPTVDGVDSETIIESPPNNGVPIKSSDTPFPHAKHNPLRTRFESQVTPIQEQIDAHSGVLQVLDETIKAQMAEMSALDGRVSVLDRNITQRIDGLQQSMEQRLQNMDKNFAEIKAMLTAQNRNSNGDRHDVRNQPIFGQDMERSGQYRFTSPQISNQFLGQSNQSNLGTIGLNEPTNRSDQIRNRYVNLAQGYIDKIVAVPRHQNSRSALDSNVEGDSNKWSRLKVNKVKIPTFSGNREEFLTFWNPFRVMVHCRNDLDNTEKGMILLDNLSGRPYKTVQSLLEMEGGYVDAVKALAQLYGPTPTTTDNMMEKIANLPTPEMNQFEVMLDNLNTCRSVVNHMAAVDANTLQGFLFYDKIEQKFPRPFVDKALDTNRISDVTSLLNELQTIIAAEQIYYEATSGKKVISKRNTYQKDHSKVYNQNNNGYRKQYSNQPPRHRKEQNFHAVDTVTHQEEKEDSDRSEESEIEEHIEDYDNQSDGEVDFLAVGESRAISPCAFCKKDHNATNCDVLPTVEARRQVLAALKLCYICFQQGHTARTCQSKTKCIKCNRKHHEAICNQDFPSGGQKANRQ